MRSLLVAIVLPVVVALLFGAVAVWDRLREPHRDPTQPFAVVDRRTYRDAQRRITRLLAAGDQPHAQAAMQAVCVWLRDELHAGPARRRVRRARELELWQLRLQDPTTEIRPTR